MKVGDYARTIHGQITKINYKWEELSTLCKTIEARVQCEDDELYDYPTEIKTSPKITDLIKIGDYVNGFKVLEIVPVKDRDFAFYTYREGIHNYLKIYDIEDIKSVVTKEQFSQMEYRVD